MICPPSGQKKILLSVDCHVAGQISQALILMIPSQGKTITLSRQGYLTNQYNLSDILPRDVPYRVGLVPIGTSGKILVDELALRQIEPIFNPPPLDRVVAFLLFIFLVLKCSRSRIFGLSASSILTGAGVCLFAFIFGELKAMTLLSNPWLWLSLMIGVIAIKNAHQSPGSGPEWSHDMLCVLFAVALNLRWTRYVSVFGFHLVTDPVGFRRLAQQFSWNRPLATEFREPLYVWIQHMALVFLGPNTYQFRLVTVFLSLATVYATYHLFKKISANCTVALLSALFVACNGFAVYVSVLGERTDLFNLLIILYCLVSIGTNRRPWISEILLGILGAAIGLTWLFGMAGVALLYGWRCITTRMRGPWLLGVATLIVLLLPYFIYEWKANGDPLYALNTHASNWRRAELEGLSTTPEPPTTWVRYIFKEQGLRHLAHRVLSRYLLLFFDPTNLLTTIFFRLSFSGPYLMFPFYLVGMILELRRRRYMPLIMMGSFLNLAPYFMDEIVSPRYLFFVLPFFAYFWATGLEQASQLIGFLVGREL